jgi:RimJ/RimL family protein N-acetyltransferase
MNITNWCEEGTCPTIPIPIPTDASLGSPHDCPLRLTISHHSRSWSKGSGGSRQERAEWLDWTVRNTTALARLYQPPYGERGIELKESGALIGAVGLVPCCGPFETLPTFRALLAEPPSGLFTAEIGLFWAVSAAQRGRGYATEAARALTDFAFGALNLKRIVATTEYDNPASIAVMRHLGMIIDSNPHPTPEWFQVVGVLVR